jgi:anti-anti-sigma factor
MWLAGRSPMFPFGGFSVDVASGSPVVATPQFMNNSNAGDLRAALRAAADHGNATLVIDMSDTDFCDLTAFGELERAHQRAVAGGGELRLVLPGSGQVLEITGADKAIRLYPTVAAALAVSAPPGDELTIETG